jgi:peptide/nickel transport system substrate-binding protein
MWNPLQREPATEWEARVDYLYNEGSYTVDENNAAEIWNEYQEIILEQLPVIYQVHSLSFSGVRNKWDNVFYDTRRC